MKVKVPKEENNKQECTQEGGKLSPAVYVLSIEGEKNSKQVH